MKNLVIDIEKHFPSAAKIFSPCDYYSPRIPMDQMVCLQPIPDETYCRDRYCIESILDWECLEEEYDKVIFVWPVHSFNDPGYTPNIEERRNFFIEIYKKLKLKKINKYIYLDDSDRAVIKRGLDWLDSENLRCDFVFKREYREGWLSDYDDRVKPFPFIMFGKPNAAWFLYEERVVENIDSKINSCFWAGDARFNNDPNTPDENVDRGLILNKIGNYIDVYNNLPPDIFISTFLKYKFFLNLNGTGHLCKRLFEGLSKNSLMIMQYTDLIFPFENDDYFSEETIFKSAEDFIEKIEILKNDENLYDICLKNQNYLIDKYFNNEWIEKYICDIIIDNE